MKTRINVALLFLLPLITFVLAVPAAAQTPDLTYIRYDVEITLHEDGRFTVSEIQQIRFGGSFSTGFAEIPLDWVSGIENVTVAAGPSLTALTPYRAGSGPLTYSVDQEGNSLYVDWEFPETKAGDEIVFVMQYDVAGGLWIYEDVNTLEWRAVAEDRSGLDVAASRVMVNLPFAVTADDLDAQAFGPAHTVDLVESGGEQRIVFEAQEPVADGTAFQVMVNFPPGLITAVPQPWQIAEDEAGLVYSIDQVDIAMTIQEDGRLAITEQQQISVSAGALYTGSRKLSWLYSDGIHVEEIHEGDTSFSLTTGSLDGCEDCYAIKEDRRLNYWASFAEYLDEVTINSDYAGATLAEWRVPAVVRGESTTFTLVYTVDGALRHNEDGTQELAWTAVPAYDAPVKSVWVDLSLPGGMGLEDVQISSAQVERAADGPILLTPPTALDAGDGWSFSIILPPGATTAAKPAWQTQLEAAFADAEAYHVRQARIDLTWFVVKIGAGVTAVLGSIAGWYLWGSRRLREAMGNYRTTPPSDLPPGLVAYLVEGKPTPGGVLASLFHLASLELIRVNLDGETLTLERIAPNLVVPGTAVTLASGEASKIPAHAAHLFNALLPVMPDGESVSLDAIQPSLQKALPGLYAAMGGEMVDHFYGSGRQERRGLLKGALPFIWFGGMALFMLTSFNGRLSRNFEPGGFIVVLFGGFILMGFLMQKLGGSRASLTELGRKEAAKWRGFQAYLKEIQRYGALEEAQAILDRYFAYAVALGVERELLAQVKAMGGLAPGWIGNGRTADGTSWHNQPKRRVWGRYGRWHLRWQQGSWLPRPPKSSPAAPASGGSGGISLQKMSDQLTGSLEGASSRMTGLLNTSVGEGGPVDVSISGAGQRQSLSWEPCTSMDTIMRDIMGKSQAMKPPRPAAGSGSRSYGGSRSSSSRRSSFGSGGSRSRSSGRSSSSRRSGGGGRRGFK